MIARKVVCTPVVVLDDIGNLAKVSIQGPSRYFESVAVSGVDQDVKAELYEVRSDYNTGDRDDPQASVIRYDRCIEYIANVFGGLNSAEVKRTSACGFVEIDCEDRNCAAISHVDALTETYHLVHP